MRLPSADLPGGSMLSSGGGSGWIRTVDVEFGSIAISVFEDSEVVYGDLEIGSVQATKPVY